QGAPDGGGPAAERRPEGRHREPPQRRRVPLPDGGGERRFQRPGARVKARRQGGRALRRRQRRGHGHGEHRDRALPRRRALGGGVAQEGGRGDVRREAREEGAGAVRSHPPTVGALAPCATPAGMTEHAPPQPRQPHGKIDLRTIARRAMVERSLLPDFSDAAVTETAALAGAAAPSAAAGPVRDMRGLLWASIDNDDSLDLDQLSVAESMADGAVKIFVAIADVDALVKKGTAIDGHARANTTSVYTAAQIF